MKIGVLGSGFMGGTHARAFAKIPDAQVVAVSSRSLEKAQKLAQEVGARATTNDMDIIEDPSVEVISNTLPTHLHREYTIAALRAGKDVLLEKPFGLTVADCDAMMEAHKQSGRLLMIAHVLRFWPEYEVLVELVQSGALGDPLAAVATRLSVPPGWAQWFDDPALSGGAVLDLMVHDFDALNWVLGKPKSIYARGQQAKPGLWNHIHAIVDYGETQGVAEGTEMMPADYPFTCALKVVCEKGVAEFMFRAGGVSVEMGGGSRLIVHEAGRSYQPTVPTGDLYERQAAYFVDCIRTQRPATMGSPEQGRLAVQVANAALASLESGAIVPL
jgi:UDP-N-acetylglucosamine 3-dehydrogenase